VTGGTTTAPGDANAGNAADRGPGARSDRSDSAVGVDDKRPDNTSVNKRDRDENAKTPIDQDENQADVKMTADIRKSIVNTEGMSVNARNVKIITSQGKVTLRGPVASADEKQKIEKFATDVAGEGNVDSQLEVAE
jgi:osmotically-inducible protein OsmY